MLFAIRLDSEDPDLGRMCSLNLGPRDSEIQLVSFLDCGMIIR
jgi:hypothetical protein